MDDNASPGKQRKAEMLEMETDEERLKRLQSALEKLNGVSGTTDVKPALSFDFTDKKPHAIPPPNELLSRVQAFLPQLEASNAVLAQKIQADPSSVDIESMEDGQDRYIEMNLGLGVFEERKAGEATSSSDHDMSDSTSSSSTSISSSDSSDDTDSSDSEDDDEINVVGGTPSSPRQIRPLPRRSSTGPRIVVLDDALDAK